MKNNETQKSIYDSEKLIESGGFLNEFLWICAGVDRKVLRQCPTDYAKYAGIGGTILFTALMAMLSGGYALFSVFDNQWVAVGFGVFWGLLIFNLDRFIVNTMYSDGKVTISMKELMAGLPRIIMAIFLGIVISTPLELKIFEDEIGITIEEMKKDKVNLYSSEDRENVASLDRRIDSLHAVIDVIRISPAASGTVLVTTGNEKLDGLYKRRQTLLAAWRNHDNEIKRLNSDVASMRIKLRAIDARIEDDYDQNLVNTKKTLENQISTNVAEIQKNRAKRNSVKTEIDEVDKQCISLGGDLKKLIEEDGHTKTSQINNVMTEIRSLSAERDTIKADIRNGGAKYKEKLDQEFGGFQAKMSAFSHMKENNSSTSLSSFFIMMLFIIVETAPTFFKMMIASGPYDDLLRAEMHRVKILSDKRISDINDEINTSVKISVEKNRERLEAELAANKLVMEELANAQAELLKQAIDDWREKELIKVKEDPSRYIRSVNEHPNR